MPTSRLPSLAADSAGAEGCQCGPGQTRAVVWAALDSTRRTMRSTRTAPVVIDLDATLVTTHWEKERAAPTLKGGFGFPPLVAFVDYGPRGSGRLHLLPRRASVRGTTAFNRDSGGPDQMPNRSRGAAGRHRLRNREFPGSFGTLVGLATDVCVRGALLDRRASPGSDRRLGSERPSVMGGYYPAVSLMPTAGRRARVHHGQYSGWGIGQASQTCATDCRSILRLARRATVRQTTLEPSG